MATQNGKDLLISKVEAGEIDPVFLIKNLMDRLDAYDIAGVVTVDYPEYVDELDPNYFSEDD